MKSGDAPLLPLQNNSTVPIEPTSVKWIRQVAVSNEEEQEKMRT